jgi:hypothetical protein
MSEELYCLPVCVKASHCTALALTTRWDEVYAAFTFNGGSLVSSRSPAPIVAIPLVVALWRRTSHPAAHPSTTNQQHDALWSLAAAVGYPIGQSSQSTLPNERRSDAVCAATPAWLPV